MYPITLAATVLGLTMLHTIALAAAPTTTDTARERAKLHALLDAEWEWAMSQYPTWASALGDRRWNTRWTDSSPAAHDARDVHARQTLGAMERIDRAALGDADKLNYDLYLDQLRRAVELQPFGWHLIPINQRGGLQTESEITDNLRFQTVQDYEDYIARLEAFPTYAKQVTELMHEGMSRGMVQPKVIMERVPAQVAAQLVDDPKQSPFYKPFIKFPASIPESDRVRLAAAGAKAVSGAVVPAYREFLAFLTEQYLPVCRDGVGCWRLPRGEELYARFVRNFTTTDLTPDQVHDLGLAEVKRISAEMDRAMAATGFKGTREEFFRFLRTDPRFFYATGDELLAATRALCKEIDPGLVKLFRTIPRTPYGVEPIPMNIAPDTTTAYYNQPAADGSRAGTYYVNLYKPETRPKWEMVALSLHEAVPGHHFQIARAMELGDVPQFRRHAEYTAFVEGWGLYSETLGEEMGLYDRDPYSRFGRLTYEMWRAVRLVVDTGIHHKRWTREQAIEYFKANAPKSELDIVNEVDRYIAWPGQALAYKVGELKIKQLRARAEKALGAKFDVRGFHDAVLEQGAVPLDVLERHVDTWIERANSQ